MSLDNEGRNGAQARRNEGESSAAAPEKRGGGKMAASPQMTKAQLAAGLQGLSQLRREIASNGKTKTGKKAGKLLIKKT
jgi:hypothetical protein